MTSFVRIAAILEVQQAHLVAVGFAVRSVDSREDVDTRPVVSGHRSQIALLNPRATYTPTSVAMSFRNGGMTSSAPVKTLGCVIERRTVGFSARMSTILAAIESKFDAYPEIAAS